MDQPVEEIDGLQTVPIPDSVFEDTHPLWEDFLVGRFLTKVPFVEGIHTLVNKIWTLGDKTVKINVFVMNVKTVRFRIKDERTRSSVLRRGMWNLCGVHVVLSKWSPIVDMEQDEITTIPLWVIVKNVPPKYFSWKVLSAITSPLGVPKKLYPDTEACTTFDEAKVFVEVDLTKSLPKNFSFKSEKEGDTVVEFVYHRLPPRCTLCTKWVHQNSDCLQKKNVIVAVTDPNGDKSPHPGGLREDLQSRNDKMVIGGEPKTTLVETEHKESENHSDEETGIEDLGWITPTKSTRSPIKTSVPRFW
ncbi:PREDICTED: uncharacterized protein LOC104729089 [Camelina sativa]|uniref:Uncharacterized protein LOC104729089 n=1 Tax=Camelina sativa TaxID=90675 RepID=A0ABM0UTV2_CAMSA|nr:PREDICTED: uncharacterized protein LOC104729089 [Camelina sativa]